MFEQTDRPILTKNRRKEWEEAVELDRILEQERRENSLKRLQANTDQKYQELVERQSNPGMRQYSTNMSGVLGSSSPGTHFGNSNLPDLMASKREQYQKELFDSPQTNVRRGRQY